jgi:hypothetical protein
MGNGEFGYAMGSRVGIGLCYQSPQIRSLHPEIEILLRAADKPRKGTTWSDDLDYSVPVRESHFLPQQAVIWKPVSRPV